MASLADDRLTAASNGESALTAAFRPWQRQLFREVLARWTLRGAIGALAVAGLVLALGWFAPWPEVELRPWAVQLAGQVLVAGLLIACWPMGKLRLASELDARLGLGDRLATAWLLRDSDRTIARLQRANAIEQLTARASRAWEPARRELVALLSTGFVTFVLLIAPSPQQAVLDRQAAESVAVQRAADRIEALGKEVSAVSALTPEQARQLDELLQLAHADLARARTKREASEILTRTQFQLGQQLADPYADLRAEALAAMSETLATEPLTRSLAQAIQHEDSQATSEAVKALAADADSLSDVQRQGLSRAIQRAANVGRAEPASSSALRDAARAVSSGEPADAALSATEAALREAIQATTAQTSLRAMADRLGQLEAELSAHSTPVNTDFVSDTSAERGGPGGGTQPGAMVGDRPVAPAVQPVENVFVPGREGIGPGDQDLSNQPFSVRAAPRPYREVLAEYAASSRAYVDRPDVSPAVRKLVREYFQQLEEGE